MAHRLHETLRIPFDVFELVGMAAGLIAAALFVRHALPALLPGIGAGALFAAGAAAVIAGVAPFVVRRTLRARPRGERRGAARDA